MLAVFFSDNIWLHAAVLNVRPKAEINALEKQLINYNTSLFSEVLGNSSCHVMSLMLSPSVLYFLFFFLPLDLEWNWCSWIQEILMQSLLFSDLLYLKKNVKGKKKVPQSKNALTILDCVFDILIVLSQFQKFITDRFSNRGFTDLAFGLRSDVDLLLFFSLYLYKGV